MQTRCKMKMNRSFEVLEGLFLGILILPSVLCPLATAQDTRNVQEPKIPAVCTRLTASLTSAGKNDDGSTAPDTQRIQTAIDACPPGHAVALAADAQHRAFLSGPLELKSGITLLVDRGATLFASGNPREYDVHPGSCGIVNDDGRGCKPLIHVNHAPHAAVMGSGAIDGQGGQRLAGHDVSWWDLAHQAKVEDKNQNCPRLIVVEESDDFVLYGITLRNSPNFHVIVQRTNGFTAWAVKIDSPATSRNTDGIDPSSSTNVTIAYSWIRAGDDNIAIKAGKSGPASSMTILRNHFYSGHGMSIGSETQGGVSAIRVTDLTIDGADNGIRIKSDVSRGGLVRDVVYQDVCIRDTKNPIILDPFYSKIPGSLPPVYKDIKLRNVHITGGGKLTLLGLDAQHLLETQFDGVAVEGVKNGDLRAAHARFLFGPGSVNLLPAGDDIQIAESKAGEQGEAPSCNGRFLPFPDSDGPTVSLQSAVSALPARTSPFNGSSNKSPDGGRRDSFTVAADGSGDYKTIQEALDALGPNGGTVRVKPGIYREVVRVAKPKVHLQGLGDDPARVVIVYGNSASITGSTFTSATASITADDFSATGLTFQNDFSSNHALQPQGSQAVALSVTGDRAVFRNVRFLGAQDTLYAGGRSCRSEAGPCVPARQYFKDCYIEGHVDFIFGDAIALFDHCELHAIAHPEVFLTAQSKRYPDQQSAFVFDHCTITADSGVGKIFLGRPWRSYSTVVFLNSRLDAKVSPEGWREWHPGVTERLKTAFYAEFKSSGPGAATEHRDPSAHQLTEAEAQKFAPVAFLVGRDGTADGWAPVHP